MSRALSHIDCRVISFALINGSVSRFTEANPGPEFDCGRPYHVDTHLKHLKKVDVIDPKLNSSTDRWAVLILYIYSCFSRLRIVQSPLGPGILLQRTRKTVRRF